MWVRLGLGILVFLLAIMLVADASCGGGTVDRARELEPVQVREYQGERLSSINEFRENSISGPQYVDSQTYRLKITGLVQQPRTLTYD
jgi:DMSO/TMAO reductase YedYZ molybdopterin-dependent catalytic subunit